MSDYISLREAGELIGRSERTIGKWVQSGWIAEQDVRRDGRRIYVSRAAVRIVAHQRYGLVPFVEDHPVNTSDIVAVPEVAGVDISDIRVRQIDGEMWFKLVDVVAALGTKTNPSLQARSVPNQWLRKLSEATLTDNKGRDSNWVSFEGVVHICARARGANERAERLRDWAFSVAKNVAHGKSPEQPTDVPAVQHSPMRAMLEAMLEQQIQMERIEAKQGAVQDEIAEIRHELQEVKQSSLSEFAARASKYNWSNRKCVNHLVKNGAPKSKLLACYHPDDRVQEGWREAYRRLDTDLDINLRVRAKNRKISRLEYLERVPINGQDGMRRMFEIAYDLFGEHAPLPFGAGGCDE